VSSESFDDLMSRLQDGDETAAAEIFDRFTSRLLGLARGRLERLKHKEDPDDAVQSAYKSFFRGQAEGKFTLKDWDSLLGLLVTITLKKCGHRLNYYLAARRDVRREQARRPAPKDSAATWQALARDPTPSEAAVLAETVQEIMRGLDERQRTIVELALQGKSNDKIATGVSCSQRTLQRVLERVRVRLERQSAEKP